MWHTDNTFWFSCAPTAYKARNLRINPHVAVTTDSTVEFVSVEGVAAEVAAPSEVARAWARKYDDGTGDGGGGGEQDVAEMEAFFASNAAFQVRPAKGIGMIERPDEFAEKATRWVFDA